jgi:crossover junction endodeoxyribonuclease RuvC
MKVLGIDPGLADTGFAVVEEVAGRFSAIELGLIKTRPTSKTAARFKELYRKVSEILKIHRPVALSLETLFFNKNSKTAFLVGRSSGVVLLAAAESGVPVFEYTPPEVKAALTGYGRADKQQVQKMVRMLLGYKNFFKTDDVADAAAIALCHLQNARFQQKVSQGR